MGCKRSLVRVESPRPSSPNCNDESIGVGVAQRMDFAAELKTIIEQLTNESEHIETVICWFDTPDQLELLEKAI